MPGYDLLAGELVKRDAEIDLLSKEVVAHCKTIDRLTAKLQSFKRDHTSLTIMFNERADTIARLVMERNNWKITAEKNWDLVARLQAALRGQHCPSGNGLKTVGECVDSLECGCDNASALAK